MIEAGPEETSAFRPDQAWHPVAAEELAGAVIATWRAIEAELTPLIGHRGVAAMYQRSLQLGASTHPWLSAAHGDVIGIDYGALEREINRQESAEAVAGARTALRAFHELLVGLVGDALTNRILRSIRAGTPGAAPAQGTKA